MSDQVGSRVRLMVVDDHDLFRSGLSSLLASTEDLEVVAQASGGRMAIRLARELRPDVILMDLSMPDVRGDEATRAILEHDPNVRIVMLTVAADDNAVAVALRAGARGYLLKDSPIDEVAGAVRAAARGDPWLAPRAADALLERIRAESPERELDPTGLDLLTARELEVLRLIARGRGNAEIASELGISSRTAKNHVSAILTKLELSNRVQAAVYAVQHGLD